MSFADLICPKCRYVYLDEIVNFVLPKCPVCDARMIIRATGKKR